MVTTFSWKPRDINHVREESRSLGLDSESQQLTGKKGQWANLLPSFPAFFLLPSMWSSWVFLIMIGKHLQNTQLQDGLDVVAVWGSLWWKRVKNLRSYRSKESWLPIRQPNWRHRSSLRDSATGVCIKESIVIGSCQSRNLIRCTQLVYTGLILGMNYIKILAGDKAPWCLSSRHNAP